MLVRWPIVLQVSVTAACRCARHYFGQWGTAPGPGPFMPGSASVYDR